MTAPSSTIDQELATGEVQDDRNWFVTKSQNHTLTVIPGPNLFLMGSPATDAGRSADESLHRRRMERSFAIGTKEVSMKQLAAFLKAVPGITTFSNWRDYSPQEDCP